MGMAQKTTDIRIAELRHNFSEYLKAQGKSHMELPYRMPFICIEMPPISTLWLCWILGKYNSFKTGQMSS